MNKLMISGREVKILERILDDPKAPREKRILAMMGFLVMAKTRI